MPQQKNSKPPSKSDDSCRLRQALLTGGYSSAFQLVAVRRSIWVSTSHKSQRTPWHSMFFCFFLASVLSLALQATPVASSTDSSTSPVILVLGDSLSAAYGIAPEKGWVALLQQRLLAERFPHRVVNASISGETSSGGLRRITAALAEWQPALVILELGGNDGLRGTPLAVIKNNLQGIVEESQQAGADVLLLSIQIPPNYGPRYTTGFENVYDQLADSTDIPLVPFFLSNVAVHPHLMQADGIHPTSTAQPIMLDNVWPALQALLEN